MNGDLTVADVDQLTELAHAALAEAYRRGTGETSDRIETDRLLRMLAELQHRCQS